MNHNLVEINNVALGIKEYANQRVVTFKDIDKIHERPTGTARNAFKRNKKRFIEGQDYFVHDTYEARNLFGIIAPNGVTTITESGYLMISKVFDDDLAWNIQRQLISSYFRFKGVANEPEHKLANIFETMTIAFSAINDRLTKLEESTDDKTLDKPEFPIYKKPYNPWFSKMQPKYKLLEKYFDVTRGTLYKNILMEMENLYDIDTQQITADYLYERNLPSCYPLEPYEFEPKYRDMIEQIVNSNLVKFNIVSENDPIASTKHVTIFDHVV